MRFATLLAAYGCLGIATVASAQSLSFRQPLSFPVGSAPFDLIVTDINGDDHLDVISANFNDGTISVLLGTGTGDFTNLDDFPASTAPLKFALGRLDGDENPDLIVTEGESDFMYLLRGNGDGRFQEGEIVDIGPDGHDPYAVAIADMNHDDKNDIVQSLAIEGSSGRVNVLLGDGEGHFRFDQENAGRRVNGPSYGVVVGDFNEDTHPDVAATALGRPPSCDMATCGTLAILLGDGAGNLDRSVDFPTGASPFALAAIDFDKDTHLDILTADSADNVISFFKGDGHGNFTRTAQYPTGVTPGSLVLIDFNNDSWPEAVVGNTRSGDISVLPGLPGGGFGPSREFIAGSTLYAAAAGDFNEDTRLDLVGISQGDFSPSASLLLAREDGGFDAAQTVMALKEATGGAAGDIRGSGIPDLVLGVGGEAHAEIFTPTGTQSFAAPVELSTVSRPNAVALRDLNGDGRADFVASVGGTARLLVALADGIGGFGAVAAVDLDGAAASFTFADLDDDGNLDIAAPSSAQKVVSLLYGNGDGTFTKATPITLTGLPIGSTTGDFNGDGIDDVAVGNAQQAAVTLIPGNRERELSAVPVAVSGFPGLVAAADLDADGHDDLVASIGTMSNLRLLWGKGNNEFDAAQVSIGKAAANIVLRDVTGDLRADILVTLQGDTVLGILENRGERGFNQRESFFLGLRPNAIAAADFNVDGLYDIAVSGNGSWVMTNEGEGRVLRGDGNGDGVRSLADLVALRRAGRITRVEDLLRSGGGTNAGADVNGDGLLDRADELQTIRALFQ